MQSVVATRYARALVDVVTAPGSDLDPAKALDQLKQIDQLISGSHELRVAFLSPAIAPARKRAVIAKLLEPMGVHNKVRNFLYIIIDHRRVGDFSSIVEAFESLADERLGLVQASVTTVHALDDARQARIQEQLSRIAGKKAKVKFSQDPALLGGVVARVGSTVFDGSVRGQLERLRIKLGS